MKGKKTITLRKGLNLVCVAAVIAIAGLFPVRACAQCFINMSGADQQTIDGFGFSTAWCPTVTSAQAEILYGTGRGQLGFSLLRVRMDDDGPYYHHVEKQKANTAIAHSYGAMVMGTQWTVPSQWATNPEKNDASPLIPSAAGAYASYLKMTAETIGLDYVSFKNEPDLASWTPTEIHSFVKNHCPTIGKPIIMPESFRFDDAYSDPVLNDPSALSNVAIVGGHVYGNGVYPHSNALARGKRVWQTEHFIAVEVNGAQTVGDHSTAMAVAQEVSDCMNSQMSAYIWWWIAQKGGDSFLQGSGVDTRGYMLGQFSKYIRPGSTRVSATYQPQSGVFVTAYRVNGGCTIVSINQNAFPVNQEFNIQNGSATRLEASQTSSSQNMADMGGFDVTGGTFTATLPPQSVTTFVQPTPPVIAHQPTSVNVFPGGNATFAVTAAGIKLNYQWYFNGMTLPGAKNPVLSLTGVQASQVGNYSVNVRNGTGSVTSSVASLSLSPLVWSPPVTISSKTDISTAGTLLYAYNNSGRNATANGVTFSGMNSTNSWGDDVTLSGLDGSLTSTFAGSSNAPWNNLGADYQKILQGGAFTWGSGPATVTLKNLVLGHQYQVQVWVNDSRAGGSATRTETVTGANTVTLAYNTTQAQDGVGQYTIGAFIATATTQSFTMDGGNDSTQINAIQVRDVTNMIAWGTPATISNATDISTFGTLQYAYNGSGLDAAVNGVTFTGVNSATTWGTGVTLSGFNATDPSTFQGGNTYYSPLTSPWSGLLAGYQRILQGGSFNWSSGVATVTLNSLVVNRKYQVQVWVNDSRDSIKTGTVTGANTVTLTPNSLVSQDGVGQFVIGTFTATTANQSFALNGGIYAPQINAIQLRDITGAQLPPTGLVATAVSSSQINLSWNASPGATGYNIYRSTSVDGGGRSPINGSTPVTTTSYSDMGISVSTPFYYVVSAINDQVESANSNKVSASVFSSLPVTSGLVLCMDASRIAGVAQNNVVSTWTDSSGTANNAVRQSGSSAGYPMYVTDALNGKPVVRFSSTDTVGDGFSFDRISTIRTVFWVLKESAGLSAGHFLLGDDSTYQFHRKSANGPLWDSNYADGNIRNGTTKLMGTVIDGTSTPLPSESFQVISLVTAGNVQANRICQDRTFHGSWQGDIAEILIYDRALTAAEEVEVGSYLSNKYALSTAYPSVPTGVSATPTSSGTISVNWPVKSDAMSYTVSYRTTSGGTEQLVAGLSVSPYIISGLTNGISYDFKVSVTNSAGTSAYSGVVSATPQADSAKDILTFYPVATISLTDINVVLPFGSNVTAIAPIYTVSANATGSPISGTPRNFTTPQTYTITAEDRTTRAYTVTVTVAPPPLTYDFNHSTLQGWNNRVWNGDAWIDLAANATTYSGTLLPTSANNGLFVPSNNSVWVSGSNDLHLNTLWLRSPQFYLNGTGDLTVELAMGIANTIAPANDSVVPFTAVAGGGWKGVALRRVSDGVFVLNKPRNVGNDDSYRTVTFTQAELATLNFSTAYTLELINSDKGNWGWVTMDNVSIPGIAAPVPASAYEVWAAEPLQGLTMGVNSGPLDDPDRDGLPNILEFALGGAAMAVSHDIQPVLAKQASSWIFEYNRSDASASVTTQVVEYGDNLTGWTPVTIPATSSGMVEIIPGDPSDKVKVTIPIQGSRTFVRLKVSQ